MSVMTFDTLKYAKNLKTHGFNEQQAEVLVEAQKEVLNQVLSAQVMDRSDMRKIEKELLVMRWMTGLIFCGVLVLVVQDFF